MEFTKEEKAKMAKLMNAGYKEDIAKSEIGRDRYLAELRREEGKGGITAKNRDFIELIIAFKNGYANYGPMDTNSPMMQWFRLMADGSYRGEPYYRRVLKELEDTGGNDKKLRSMGIRIMMDALEDEYKDHGLSRSTLQHLLVKYLGDKLELTNKMLVAQLKEMAKEHDIGWAMEYRSTGPGKFEVSGNIGERLHAMTMEGGADEEEGSSTEGPGWYGLMINTGIKGAEHVIVTEDSQGFFDYDSYPSEKAARAAWKKIQAEFRQAEEEAEE